MAGTLTISTLSDGTNSTSSTNCIQGSAKAWVSFNGTGTVAINSAYNVSSITDNGTGDYTVNFTNAMINANYGIVGNTNNSVSTAGTAGFQGVMQDSTNPPTTSSVRIRTIRGTVSFADFSLVSVAVFSS